MRSHILKCDHAPFEAMYSGKKRFEFRRNDREFTTGDILTLEEYTSNAPTHRRYVVKVTYILRGPEYGVPLGYCVMSIEDYRS